MYVTTYLDITVLIIGGGDKDKGRRGVHSRKLLSSSDDDSD